MAFPASERVVFFYLLEDHLTNKITFLSKLVFSSKFVQNFQFSVQFLRMFAIFPKSIQLQGLEINTTENFETSRTGSNQFTHTISMYEVFITCNINVWAYLSFRFDKWSWS